MAWLASQSVKQYAMKMVGSLNGWLSLKYLHLASYQTATNPHFIQIDMQYLCLAVKYRNS